MERANTSKTAYGNYKLTKMMRRRLAIGLKKYYRPLAFLLGLALAYIQICFSLVLFDEMRLTSIVHLSWTFA